MEDAVERRDRMTDTFDNRYRSAWCGQVRAEQVDTELRVAGWVHRRRDHGGLIFIDLRDREGLLQLVFHPEDAKEAHAAAGRLRAEDVVSAAGKVVRREEGTVNPNLPTGEVELAVSDFDLLADADTPPFQIDEDDPVSEELRLRYRYLDLRKPAMSEALALRARVVSAIRRRLDGAGFIEVETPTLTRSTPEGARDYLVPSRIAPGSLYALPQSPQIFKQLLMVGGLERYYQIARCYRDESARADRLPEFTQLDVEMSFVEEDDVIATVDPAAVGGAGRGRGGGARSDRADHLRRRDAALRHGPPRPAHPDRDRRPGRGVRVLGVQGVRRRAGGRRRGAWLQREWRVPALALRRPHRTRAAASEPRAWSGAWSSPTAGARRWPSSCPRRRSRG